MPPVQPPSLETINPDGSINPGPAVQPPPQTQNEPPPQPKADDAPPPKVDAPKVDEPKDGDEGEESNVDFDQFIEAAGKIPTGKPQEKKDNLLPSDADKDKSKDSKTDKDDSKSDDGTDKTVNPITKADVSGRDYTGIDETDVPLFKKMGNETFAKLKPVYLENKQLKAEKAEWDGKYKTLNEAHEALKKNGPQFPESYHEHPSAFILSPEFTETAQAIQMAQGVKSHWEQQLDAIAKGAEEIQMLTFNPQTGQYVYGNKIKADKAGELTVMNALNHVSTKIQQYNTDLSVLQKTHGDRHKASISQVAALEEKMFGNLDKPDHKPVYDPLIKSEFDALPSLIKNSPAGKYVAKAHVMLNAFAKLLNQAKEETIQLREQVKKGGGTTNSGKPRANGGPTGSDIAADSRDKSGNAEVSITDFESVKGGYN